MVFIRVKSKDEFYKILKENPKVAVDFSLLWSEECRRIFPAFVRCSYEFQGITCAIVDVDKNRELAVSQGVSNTLPTFHFFQNGEKIDGFAGEGEEALRERLEVLASR